MKRSVQILCLLLVLLIYASCTANTPYIHDEKTSVTVAQPSDTPEPTHVLTSMPTSILTDTPTATSTPAPTPTPQPITQERIDSGEFDSFFDDTLLIGDSLTEFFSFYILARRKTETNLLGTARLFGVKGMNIKTACQDIASADRNYLYRGRKVSITELINACKPKRVFIMLGVNDVADRPWDVVQSHFAQLIDVIHEKCPDTEVVIQGVLPITKQYCDIKGVKITYYNGFNEILAKVCEEHGAEFLDFSKDMMDEEGYLELTLCSDQLFHLSKKGEAIWVKALRLYAASRMYPDAEILLS